MGTSRLPREIGFWDYTCPGNGSLEHYTREDWDVLLDDMVAGGLNSFVLCVKWLTTGYRSRLPWLDQDLNCTAIASDNALIHYALAEARKRGLRTWLLVVSTQYKFREFGLTPYASGWGPEGAMVANYDLDCPGLPERIEQLYDEIFGLFGSAADGLVVELEFCDGEAPHRIPLYNEWAARNQRPDFAAIKDIRLEPRSYPFTHWRDFTTSRRIEMLRRIERVVRGHGFTGPIAHIAEVETGPTIVMGNVNLTMLKEALPDLRLVTYDSRYDRRVNRLATMDCCVHQPRAAGFEVCYLTRGVMTFDAVPWLPPTTLPEQWRLEFEDALQHQPETVWFMGSDARIPAAMVCSSSDLPRWGFPDGVTARRAFLRQAREAGLLPA